MSGGGLRSFSIFALGVSPYITAQIIVQLLSKDVLPALTELSKQGEYGRKKSEMATRYLTLLLGAVQAYGIIKTMENKSYITLNIGNGFWAYAYIIVIILAGSMLMMWLGDQITSKGLGNGISVIIFAGCVRSLPIQIRTAFNKWISQNVGHGANELLKGSFQFLIYILVFILIIAFVIFIELSKRKIPVQHAGRGGANPSMAKASFLPIKINSAGVIPVIFATAFLSLPALIGQFVLTLNPENTFGSTLISLFTAPSANNFSTLYPNGITAQWFFYPTVYFILVILFTYFYTSIMFNTKEIADTSADSGDHFVGRFSKFLIHIRKIDYLSHTATPTRESAHP